MTRTLRLPVTAGLCLALLGLPACKGREAKADDANTAESGGNASSMALPVVGEPARKGDLVLSVTTTGQVRSDAVAELKSETSGTVLKVLVQPGDRVKKGEPLVRLDPRPFDLAVREAQAQLEQAQMRYRDDVVPDSIVSGSLPENGARPPRPAPASPPRRCRWTRPSSTASARPSPHRSTAWWTG